MDAFGSLPHLKVARGNFKLMRNLMVLNHSVPATLSLSRMNPKFDRRHPLPSCSFESRSQCKCVPRIA